MRIFLYSLVVFVTLFMINVSVYADIVEEVNNSLVEVKEKIDQLEIILSSLYNEYMDFYFKAFDLYIDFENVEIESLELQLNIAEPKDLILEYNELEK